jgi:hypothetical protein
MQKVREAMRIDQVEVAHWYEARVPIHGSTRDKMQYYPVYVIGKGDSYLDGDRQMVAVIYAAPMSPRGTGIALVSPAKMRLRVARMEKNEEVASPDR